ncbi:DUF4491 family protein [Candidatus Bathyarchaeota archaeon]|nr:DUF4491 family protein [Candidatus Bathyarchaeota archaeon]MBL7079949.1 DUF4491 family protein [Candidatus Bathyarchaeota archaeon]
MHWPAFALAGVALVMSSMVVENRLISNVLRAAGYAVAWSTPEIIKQREKGWYPRREKRER